MENSDSGMELKITPEDSSIQTTIQDKQSEETTKSPDTTLTQDDKPNLSNHSNSTLIHVKQPIEAETCVCTSFKDQVQDEIESKLKNIDESTKHGLIDFLLNQKDDDFEIDDNIFQTKVPGLGLPDIRIAVVGRSGSGKSSIINTLTNIFEGRRYDEERVFAITQTLSIEVEDKPKIIELKSNIHAFKDKQTDLKNGNQSESQTQHSNIYSFRTENCNISLIDTPGIGDTRGFDQDKKNIKSVVEALKASEKFNAICLVFKGTDQRVDQSLKYLISQYQSLMTKESQNNIVVCFTFVDNPNNVPAKKALVDGGVISADTPTFNFDNSCLIPLSEYELKTQKSKKKLEDSETNKWESNYFNAQKMILRISKMKAISGTTVLNLYLKRDLAYQKANQEIQNIKVLTEEQNNVERQKSDLDNIIQKIKQTDGHTTCNYKQIKVKRKRTVNKKVQKTLGTGRKATLCVNHDILCHEDCSLDWIKDQGDISFLNCAAFCGATECLDCKCNYKYHLHDNKYFVNEDVIEEYSDYETTTEILTDQEIKKQNEILKKEKIEKEKLAKIALEKLDMLESDKKASYSIIATFYQEIDKVSSQKKTTDILFDYFNFRIDEINTAYEKNHLTLKQKTEEIAKFEREIETYKTIQDIMKLENIDPIYKKKAQELLDEAIKTFESQMKRYDDDFRGKSNKTNQKKNSGFINTIKNFFSMK